MDLDLAAAFGSLGIEFARLPKIAAKGHHRPTVGRILLNEFKAQSPVCPGNHHCRHGALSRVVVSRAAIAIMGERTARQKGMAPVGFCLAKAGSICYSTPTDPR